MKFQHLAVAALAVSLSLVGATVTPAFAVNPSCSGFDSTAQSTTTGVMSCDVPTGMTQMQVVATGAGGGGGAGVRTSTGGHGAIVSTVISVTPGETLTLEIGTGGAAGSSAFGGGGGGWTAIKRGSTLLVVAGAGGGGGAAGSGTSLAVGLVFAGGNAGQNGSGGLPAGLFGTSPDIVGSGSGGTQQASSNGGQGAGGGSNSNAWGLNGTSGSGGRAGESINVGAGGGSFGGSTWQGGASAGVLYSGGGGGAGYFGGGGGGAVYGSSIAGGSGGGGSSFVLAGTGTSFAVASNGGTNHAAGSNGSLVLSVYTPPAPSPSPSPSAQSTLTLAPGFVVGDLAPNAPVTLSGTDLQASSNWYAEMRSTPVTFAAGVTDSSGNFSLGSNLPSNVTPGQHTITLYGTANDGSQWTRVLYITVGENLRVTYMSTSGAELASTGANVIPGVIGGVALLAGGLALIFVTRRRKFLGE